MVRTEFWSINVKGLLLGRPTSRWKIKIKWTLKKLGRRVWTEFIWLTRGTSSWLL